MHSSVNGRGWRCPCIPKPVYWHHHLPQYDPPEDEIDCSRCGEAIPNPYPDAEADYLDERKTDDWVCSRCGEEARERRRQARLREAATPESTPPPAVCHCGFTLDKCMAGTCTDWPKIPLQGRLF